LLPQQHAQLAIAIGTEGAADALPTSIDALVFELRHHRLD
jgi:hypothetical protein